MPSNAWAGSDVLLGPPNSPSSTWLLTGVSDLQVNWEANRPGMLSFRVAQRQVETLAASGSGAFIDTSVLATPSTGGNPIPAQGGFLFGQMVSYEHPTAGYWSGIVTNVSYEDGVMTVGAEGLLARGRRYLYQPPDTIEVPLRIFLRKAVADPPGLAFPLTIAAVPDISIEPYQGDVLDDILANALDLAASDISSKWVNADGRQTDAVAPYIRYNMRTRAMTLFADNPQPASQTLLAQGNNVIGWSVTQDRWAGANIILVRQRFWQTVGKKQLRRNQQFVSNIGTEPNPYGSASAVGMVMEEQLQLRGTRPDSRAAQAAANQIARNRAKDFLTFTLRVVDRDNAFANLASANEYGTVLATLDLGPVTKGPYNTSLPVVRVVARTLDVQTGVMTCVCTMA